ncbi:MAG TPA: hypothetical protein VNL77_19325, partial [Roseiflexaceae bacterium]|nr:hypothetical protein [Roseiflexaceae bacterium]
MAPSARHAARGTALRSQISDLSPRHGAQRSALSAQISNLASEVDLATYTAWVREAAIAARRGDRLGLEEA